MTGSQQSGSGGNPEFDKDKEPAGGADETQEPATGSPGQEGGDKSQRRASEGGRYRQGSDQQGNGGKSEQTVDEQQSQGPARQGQGANPVPSRQQPSTQKPREREPGRSGHQGQPQEGTGTPGGSDTPEDDGTIFDENKAGK